MAEVELVCILNDCDKGESFYIYNEKYVDKNEFDQRGIFHEDNRSGFYCEQPYEQFREYEILSNALILDETLIKVKFDDGSYYEHLFLEQEENSYKNFLIRMDKVVREKASVVDAE